ncbi:MAG: HDOD domain-containing protein [Phycisphaeraceae bacterium]|nr:HDOD domain-containing protein [Phycisphaeraceae bacterium]
MSRPSPILNQLLSSCDLPALPSAVVKLVNLLDQSNVSFEQIADALSQDAQLAASVLKTVNSSYYGLSHKLSSINQAVSLLGIKKIRDLTVGCSLSGYMKKTAAPSFDPVWFWRHSLFTGSAARMIAIHVRDANPEEAQLAGLLKSIGALAMAVTLRKTYTVLLQHRWQRIDQLAAAEREALDIDHAQVSAAMLEAWRLPAVLVEQIRYTYNTDAAPPRCQRATHVIALASLAGDLMVDIQIGHTEQFFESAKRFVDQAAAWFAVDWSQADRLINAASDAAFAMADMFKVDVGDKMDYDKMFASFDITHVNAKAAA